MSRQARVPGMLLAIGFSALFVAGCAKEESSASKKPAEAAGELKPSDIKVTVVDKEGFQKAIAAHRGKVVLVDYWATWCPPCVKQFPHTVELGKRFGDRGLDVVALSFDEPEDVPAVQKFLAEKGATFENLISKVGAAESSAEEFDYDGALPHYIVFDREGKVVKHISPSDPTISFHPDLIDQAVEEQLAIPAAK